MPLTLNKDFEAFLKLLDANGVDYLVVGGYAVVAYGYVRYTGDIHCWIRPTRENAERILKVLAAFGFDPNQVDPQTLTEMDQILRMGRPPGRIEILTSIDGVNFDDCFARRLLVPHQGMQIPLIAYDDLLINKRASGRLKDLADVDELQRVHPQTD